MRKFSVWQMVILPILHWLGVLRFFAFINRHKLIILFYHGVNSEAQRKGLKRHSSAHIDVGQFEKQMKHLSTRYNIIDLDTAVKAIENKKHYPPYSVVITFDDGYKNNYTVALPVLKLYGLKAAIFVATGFIDTGELPWWEQVEEAIDDTGLEKLEIDFEDQTAVLPLGSDINKLEAVRQVKGIGKKLSQPKRREFVRQIVDRLGGTEMPSASELFLSWGEVKELNRQGMTIGAHTVNHVSLARETRGSMAEEISGSKKRIEEQLGERTELFAYPDGGPGTFNDDTRKVLIDAGFRCALLTIPGMNDLNSDPYELKRIWVSGADNFFGFLAGLSGFKLFTQSCKTKISHLVR